jgi:hypothetical protein
VVYRLTERKIRANVRLADKRTSLIPVFLLGIEYDALHWKDQKPDYYAGRLNALEGYVSFVGMLESILSAP